MRARHAWLSAGLAAALAGAALPAAAATFQGLVNGISPCPAGQNCPGTGLPGAGGPSPTPSVSPTAAATTSAAANVGYPLLNPNGPRSAVPITTTSVLDPAFYMATYPDLMAAFRGNADQARNHWLQFGIREGRQSAANFYVAAYLARYDDLKIAFGNNYEAALRHWIDNGSREGRDASATGRFPMGAIIRLPDNGATYVVDANGAKRWITSGPVFDGCGLTWNMAQDLRRAVIDAVPNGPNLNTAAECQAALKPPLPPGFLLRNSTNGATHVVDASGAKRWITSPQVFDGCGLNWAQARNVFKLVFDRVPEGAPLQTAAQCQALMASLSQPVAVPQPLSNPPPTLGKPAQAPVTAAGPSNTQASVAAAFKVLSWEQVKYVIDRDPGMKRSYDQAGANLQAMMQLNPSSFPWETVTRNRDQATLDRIAGLIAEAYAPTLARSLASLPWPQFQKVGQAETAAVGDLYRPNPAALQPIYQNNEQGWITVLSKYSTSQILVLKDLIDRARSGSQ
jgi:hypothetical protein